MSQGSKNVKSASYRPWVGIFQVEISCWQISPPPSKSPDITEFTNLTFQELPMVWKCVLSCSPEFLFSFNSLQTFWVDFLEFLMLFISLFNFIFIFWVTEVGSLAFSSKLQFSQLFPLKWRSVLQHVTVLNFSWARIWSSESLWHRHFSKITVH